MKDKFADKLYDCYRLKEDNYRKYKILSSNYVIDVNQSVKWNKEEHPEILKSFAQFKYIWERSNDDSLCYGYHSVMEDFEDRLDDFEEFRKLGELE